MTDSGKDGRHITFCPTFEIKWHGFVARHTEVNIWLLFCYIL